MVTFRQVLVVDAIKVFRAEVFWVVLIIVIACGVAGHSRKLVRLIFFPLRGVQKAITGYVGAFTLVFLGSFPSRLLFIIIEPLD